MMSYKMVANFLRMIDALLFRSSELSDSDRCFVHQLSDLRDIMIGHYLDITVTDDTPLIYQGDTVLVGDLDIMPLKEFAAIYSCYGKRITQIAEKHLNTPRQAAN